MSNSRSFMTGLMRAAGMERQTRESELERPIATAKAIIQQRLLRAVGVLVAIGLWGHWTLHVLAVTAMGYPLLLRWLWKDRRDFISRREQREFLGALFLRAMAWALPAWLYLNYAPPLVNDFIPAPRWGVDWQIRETLLAFDVPPWSSYAVIALWLLVVAKVTPLLFDKGVKATLTGLLTTGFLLVVPVFAWLSMTQDWQGVAVSWCLPGWVTPLRLVSPVVLKWATTEPMRWLEFQQKWEILASNLLDSFTANSFNPGDFEWPDGEVLSADGAGAAQVLDDAALRKIISEELAKSGGTGIQVYRPADKVDYKALEELRND